MGLPADTNSTCRTSVWLKLTGATTHVCVTSKVAWFMGHWSSKRRGSVRCLGTVCPICAGGESPRPFLYVGVVDENGDARVFEIPRRSRPIAEQLEASETGGIGAQLAIRKEGKAKNSPISVVVTGWEDVKEFDIWPFVSTLGLSLEPVQEPRVEQAPNPTRRNPFLEPQHFRAM